MSEGQILARIKALQATRFYADEVESRRLGAQIDKLLDSLEKSDEERKEEMTAEQEKRATVRRALMHRASIANHAINAIEEIARAAGIKITVNFGAELAHTRDAITELAEQIHKL